MTKVIIVAALQSEFFAATRSVERIFYTGIGKINASSLVTQLIIEERPDLILNVGTAGCLQSNLLGGVFGIKEVIERDMMAEPLAQRGTVPLSKEPPIFKSDFGDAKCATGDSFVTRRDKWLIDSGVDLVDMELFAIAKVASRFGVKWRAIKFASDLANEDAAKSWSESLESSNSRISEMIDKAVSD
jgi:adenosylhomocysteine nucleosidase